MKSFTFPSVEPLESRIAPAVTINVGHPGDPGEVDYNTVGGPFHSTHLGGNGYDAGDSLGANFVGGTNTYYLKLTTGDRVRLFNNATGYQPILQDVHGTVVAFFVDKNNDGIVQANELTGLSLGKNVSLIVKTDVDGDIVTNFNDATGKIVPTSLISSKQGISALTADNLNKGDASNGQLINNTITTPHFGSLLSGGTIAAAHLKSVYDIDTGLAANGVQYSFNYADTGISGLQTLNTTGLLAAKAAGPSINNVNLTAVHQIHASDGGIGGAGGSITNLTVGIDTDGFLVLAGNGGNGNSTILNGGAGGRITHVFAPGPVDNTNDDAIQIIAGNGGNAGTNASNKPGLGGAGGAASNITIGYNQFFSGPVSSKTLDQHQAPSFDDILVRSGSGGSGLSGGNAGNIKSVFLSTNAPGAATYGTLQDGSNAQNEVQTLDVPATVQTGTDPTIILTFGNLATNALHLNTLDDNTLENALNGMYSDGQQRFQVSHTTNGGTIEYDIQFIGPLALANQMQIVPAQAAVIGGTGGTSDQGLSSFIGKAGAGASLNTINLVDGNESATQAYVVAGAGNGGLAKTNQQGANGGSISGVTVLAFNTNIVGGDGSSGNTHGGSGGGIGTVNFRSLGAIISTNVELDGGIGGGTTSSNPGIAGNGGSISNIQVQGMSANSLVINSGIHANGGTANIGKGGNGGSFIGMQVIDDSTSILSTAPLFNLRTGDGGNGTTAGGNGGAITNITFSGFAIDIAVQAGNGGNSTFGVGNAGAGGSISNSSFATHQLVNNINNPVATVASGNGGTGSGFANAGGAGGKISTVNVIADGNVTLTSGTGGNGLGAGVGAGGNISSSNADSSSGDVLVEAGNAGNTGTTGAAGGSIIATNIIGLHNVTIIAGDGGRGGAGGNITSVGYATQAGGAPTGVVAINAGQGSAGATTAGAGGSIVSLVGYLGQTGNTTILAGNGGSTFAAGGAGGNIQHLRILGGGTDNTTALIVAAGDAGSASFGKKGAHGGNVDDIAVDQLASGAFVKSIAAGNGGDASTSFGKGGTGGSITNVHLKDGDIGLRSSPNPSSPINFGYNTTGGLFAGTAGAGQTSGLPGSVINISANAIAGIVAGRNPAPQLANVVDKVYLKGNIATQVNPDGSYTNLNIANFVGFNTDPNAPQANAFIPGSYVDVNGDGTFDLGDIPNDGLIAAITLTANRNFVPEAYLFASGPGGFFDYKNGL